jgi:hypothetical protein
VHGARPAAAAIPRPDRLSLIHTRIGAVNLIGRGDDLRLIDWQRPAAGDLAEDIYGFLSPALQLLDHREPRTAAERDAFLAALDMPAVAERYRQLEPVFAFRMAGYCCARVETTADADDRARYVRAATAELERIRRR